MANTLIQCIGKDCTNPNREIRYHGLCYRCYVKDLSTRSAQEHFINKLQKGWTRHGGVTNGYEVRDEEKTWTCQACGQEQPSQISASLFPFEEAEVLRICPNCQNIAIKKTIQSFYDLLQLVR